MAVHMHMRALLLVLLGKTVAVKLRNGSASASLLSTGSRGASMKKPSCSCEANNQAWKAPTRTEPKCIFIDLGAADGNTFAEFLEDDYGPVGNCPHGGDWEALLVEANPQFSPKLKAIQTNLFGKVQVFPETAAYVCEAHTTFSIDPDVQHNHWGSSMMVDYKNTKQVTVPTMNVNQLIKENTIPGDWVILKVDIEGAEYDVVPCLADFKDAGSLVDILFLEEHWWFPDRTAEQKASIAEAKKKLVEKSGVRIPKYYSATL
mmetsp:Transcript_35829/g.65049  ORF Transcript_35829/g.65049 Transcript_35829/m.65049 type:complete len:261 (-) Transcript_35829:86-868(-)|eukprot:CAMPEP_0197620128 /NCGR_PEP_ID=MMETSP1338-20131121/999_1 /TAXON_ID=43686 ORGANISM="Pelagodinium beii, Strain RCC1491" /NCGR_SAMPLE_ID=MMETSP1338 /ASSEMBLY_ACC=CAM_ASM_000754 /LENGTH=260 /DNA_ID=CAMNT_0043189219 /DNA_START=40 /DNA_END=822 /DNA_ORIENTATION=-